MARSVGLDMNNAMSLVEKSYAYCMKFVRKRHELFPIASWFLPAALRKPIAVIYTFARQADDIADEGNLSSDERLRQLENYTQKINQILEKNATHQDVFLALADFFQQHPQVPPALLLDLLSAFKQDVVKNRYDNHLEVLDYSKRSANPIGRLLLHLNHQDSSECLEASDAICTALQLVNILNDIEDDWLIRNRCYLPLDEMQSLGISVEDLAYQNPITAPFQLMIEQQLKPIVVLLEKSQALWHIPGRFGFEMRLIVHSAKRMVQKLKFRKNLRERLQLSRWDWLKIMLRSF